MNAPLVVSVLLCSDCSTELEMLERYMWAPSIAWCPRCLDLRNVQYDENAQRWFVIP